MENIDKTDEVFDPQAIMNAAMGDIAQPEESGDRPKKRGRAEEDPEAVVPDWIRSVVFKQDAQTLPEDRRDLDTEGWGIVCKHGTFWRWDGISYSEWPIEEEARPSAIKFCQDTGRGTPAQNYSKNMIANLQGRGHHDQLQDAPCWIDGRRAEMLLPMRNGILDVEKWMSDDDYQEALTSQTPKLFSLAGLPYDYDPRAKAPRWQQFLDEILPEKDLQQLLCEWFGYCLIPTQRFRKFLVMQGEGANGKSIVCSLLESLVSPKNCSALGIGSLHMPHQTMALLGKTVNFSSEIRHVPNDAEEILKSITGNDTILVNPKHGRPIETRIYARMVVTTNHDLRFADKSNALWDRLMVLPFRVTIPKEKRRPAPELIAELEKELPGIFMWSLWGLKLLIERGRFNPGADTEAAIAAMRDDSNMVAIWADENIIQQEKPAEGTTQRISDRLQASTVYKRFNEWAKENGHPKPLSHANFTQSLKSWSRSSWGADGQIETKKQKVHVPGSDKTRTVQTYIGMRLLERLQEDQYEEDFDVF